MSIYRTIAVTAVAIVVSVSVVGADHVLVSGSVPGLNLDPNIAVNETTGDALIAWTQLTANGSVSRVWTSLLKRNPNGTFRAPTLPRRVSPPQGFHSNVSVAWIPAANAYFVIWDTRRIPGAASKIMGRRLNKNGGFFGPVRTLVSDGRENFGPAVAAADPVAQLVYTAKNVAVAAGEQEVADLATSYLNEELEAGRAKVVAESDGTDPFVEDFWSVDASCHLVVVQVGLFSEVPSVGVYLMRGDSVVVHNGVPQQLFISNAFFVAGGRVLPREENNLSILFNNAVTARAHLALFTVTVCESIAFASSHAAENLAVTKAETELLVRTLFPDSFAARGAAAFDILVSVDGRLESQGFTGSGQATGPLQILADDVGGALFLNGATLPAARNDSANAPDGILTWLVSKGTGSEIRALAITRN